MSDDLTREGLDHLAKLMHDAYEEAATYAGWETNPASRKPWAEVPEANKKTMRAAVMALCIHITCALRTPKESPMGTTAERLADIEDAYVEGHERTVTKGEVEWLVTKVRSLRADLIRWHDRAESLLDQALEIKGQRDARDQEIAKLRTNWTPPKDCSDPAGEEEHRWCDTGVCGKAAPTVMPDMNYANAEWWMGRANLMQMEDPATPATVNTALTYAVLGLIDEMRAHR